MKFSNKRDVPCRWVNLVSENGGGKSTVLQALALLLAGPEGAQQLFPRPHGWLRNEQSPGKLSARIHQDERDPGRHGDDKIRKAFSYSYIPYWSITIPLTLLSAYLLLVKPRKTTPKKLTDPVTAEEA